MAHSAVVPDVESTAVRIAVPFALMERIESMAAAIPMLRDEMVELLLRSRTDGSSSPAATMWEQYMSGDVQTPAAIAAELASIGVESGVRGLRLGSPSPDRGPIPWERQGLGAELWWGPEETWPAVRGLWRINPKGITVIVALRLGYVLGVYRVVGWATDPTTGRSYATKGVIIGADGRLRDPETGADAGPVSDQDRAIRSVVVRTPISLPPHRQPVVKLTMR
jgi:hypothetical protein